MKAAVSGLAVMFVVAALFSSAALSADPSEFQGILSDKKPEFDTKDPVKFSDADFKVMAAFQGRVKYLDPKHGQFVHLALAPVSGISLVDDGRENRIISFETPNATVSITFGKKYSKNHIKNISLVTKDGDTEKSCEVRDTEIIFRGQYKCETPIFFTCVRRVTNEAGYTSQTDVAHFIIDAIRAELSGDARSHKMGQFSYSAQQCDPKKDDKVVFMLH